MTAFHIRRSCTTCSSTPNKFIFSITHSLHFFLGLPTGHLSPTLTSPHLIQHTPSTLFTCLNNLSILFLSLTERSKLHISATPLLDEIGRASCRERV